jgi:CRP-like cAMP-binding protein
MLCMETPTFKSRAMVRMEQRLQRPLEEYLAERYLTLTQPQIAAELGVSDATVSRWMRELDVEARLPGQRPPAAA